MSLSKEYQQQERWRNWAQFLPKLPLKPGARILDLGCSIGSMAGLMAEQGAAVTAVDLNAELLAVARSRHLPGVTFLQGDLNHLGELPLTPGHYDGIWCSYVAAYFPDLVPQLQAWSRLLKPDSGWIALLEIDDFLAHAPLGPEHNQLLEDFTATAATYYDFKMGRKLGQYLQAAGFQTVSTEFIQDPEFTSSGPAAPEILEGWQQRLSRMQGLQRFCGERFPELESALLAAMTSPDHASQCRVVFAQASKRAHPC